MATIFKMTASVIYNCNNFPLTHSFPFPITESYESFMTFSNSNGHYFQDGCHFVQYNAKGDILWIITCSFLVIY